jgi:penicillin-binding protein 1A
MTDTDFDFDFDVGRGAAGTREEADSERAEPTPNGDGRSARASNGSDDGEAANGNGRTRRFESRADANGGTGSPAAPPRRRRRTEDVPPPAPQDAPEGDEDWLSLADDSLQREDLTSIATPDDGPAGPPRPREGRELAKSARLRATGREPEAPRRRAGVGEDFERLLEKQPQKSRAAQRGSAVLYGLRGLLDDGRERLRGGRARIGELKERVPDAIPLPASDGGGDGGRNGGNGGPPRLPRRISSRRPRKPQPGRIKKLRIAIILVGLGALAMVSTVFGMMMAVANDLPQLENKEQYAEAKNSEVFDSEGRKLGTLLSNTGRILVEGGDISPYMKDATVAIEDERFYEHSGVDFTGIARAVVADVMPGGSTQGASTITMQFVKNALEAQGQRTYFQKLREASYAYHLERQWDKDKILTQYLNTVYFGEGAYGIEAAARTYFGWNHPECMADGGEPCASVLLPHEAAMLAGIITSPSRFSPRVNPEFAVERRNLVLSKMVEQGVLTEEQYVDAAEEAPPAASDIERPAPDSLSPYFTEWLRQQLVDKYGAGRAFGGGLDVHTTLDLDMQEAAESTAYNTLAGIQPTASVVVIDNETGGVKAMVGGNDFQERPFNLATNGLRQPGSAFKPFTLITAFQNGFSPDSVFGSYKRVFPVPNSKGKEFFEVNNYDDTYYGSSDLATATIHSDNSIYAELGFGRDGLGPKGPKKIARTAHDMGIETDFSDNPAMILGGLDPGVTPLEMTYAYSTIARGGVRIGGELDSSAGPNNALEDLGPTAISKVVLPDGDTLDGGKDYKPKEMRAIPESVANSVKSILHSNVLGGTGELAQFGDPEEWGKTGTTENNGDAWFCGGSTHFTACVWVGHAQTNTPMQTEYNGGPVDGGTFPAYIWGQIMEACEAIYEERLAEEERGEDDEDGSGTSTDDDIVVPPSSSSSDYGGGDSSGSSGGGSSGSAGGGGSGQSTPAPAAPTPAAPAPTGGTGGTGL